jgi:hypothetical protein
MSFDGDARSFRPPVSRAPGLRALVSLVAVALAGLAVLAPSRHADSGFVLEVRPVPLDPQDPSRESVGALRYRGGLWLRSEDHRFGGLSDVRVTEGGRLVAISDCGYGFTARLRYDEAGSLVGLEEDRLFPLLGLGGRALGRGDVDAEALIADGGTFVVAFEGRHHLWRYSADPPLGGAPTPVPAPPGLAGCGSNQGVEAAVLLEGGQYLLITEGPSPARRAPAWVGSGEKWTSLTWPLYFADDSGGAYHPTGAAVLPGGDVLVVERRYPPLAARLRRISAEALLRGDLAGTEVARLGPPLNVDNFEAVEVLRGPRGETRVLLVSDDNDCVKRGSIRTGLQRTLVLLFDLEG